MKKWLALTAGLSIAACSLRGDLSYLGASCSTDTDCDPPAAECRVAVCDVGVCKEIPEVGKALDSVNGDCSRDVCGAEGFRVHEFDPADVPDATLDCRSYACSTAGLELLPAADSTPCSGGVCDGGACVECIDGDDCNSVEEPNCVVGLGQCVSEECSNGGPDPGETDDDCGGPECAPCANGLQCGQDSDCQSGVCGDNQRCSAPVCDDEVDNGAETDVDCGGGQCPRCQPGLACEVHNDCASLICDFELFECTTPSCSDKVQNGGESGFDCGEVCEPGGNLCPLGESCFTGADCAFAGCRAGVCMEGCADGFQNQGEVGIDCGGPCPLCQAGADPVWLSGG